jgi:hypothetical protein
MEQLKEWNKQNIINENEGKGFMCVKIDISAAHLCFKDKRSSSLNAQVE